MSSPDHAAGDPDRRRLRLSGLALGAWSFAYMLPHLYWAGGGRCGLSAVHPDAPKLPEWQAINWVASAILLSGALLGFAFAGLHRRSRFRHLLLLVGGIGCSIAISHGLYGIFHRLRDLAADGTGAESWILWDLLLFEPWFMIEGILLGAAGWLSLESHAGRLAWVGACAAGTLLALAAAVLQVRIG